MLTIDSLLKTSVMYSQLGDDYNSLSSYYNTTAHKFMSIIRNDSNWLDKFGLHSSADAINGGWLSDDEISYLFSKNYNNSINICSFSSFNQFFILTSMAKVKNVANITDYILTSIDLCWGQQIKLNGATSFYEVFAPYWPAFEQNAPIPNGNNGFTSQCHPWVCQKKNMFFTTNNKTDGNTIFCFFSCFFVFLFSCGFLRWKRLGKRCFIFHE